MCRSLWKTPLLIFIESKREKSKYHFNSITELFLWSVGHTLRTTILKNKVLDRFPTGQMSDASSSLQFISLQQGLNHRNGRQPRTRGGGKRLHIVTCHQLLLHLSPECRPKGLCHGPHENAQGKGKWASEESPTCPHPHFSSALLPATP